MAGLTDHKGSVLVLVLWILVVISFLSSEYVAHNREKAAIVLQTTARFQREAAESALLELFASSQYELLKTKAQEKNADAETDSNKSSETIASSDDIPKTIQDTTTPWIRLRPGGVEVWVKIEDESSKIKLSLDQESSIRETIHSIYGKEWEEDADTFTDSLLDWLDPDDLIRLSGAEKAYYNATYPPSDPGNGPFKSMSQISLVRWFDPSRFWGEPYEYISELPIYDYLKDNYESAQKSHTKKAEKDKKGLKAEKEIDLNGKISSIMEQFTIYPKEYVRVSMLIPGDDDIWYNEIFWLNEDGNSFKIADQLSRVMVLHIDQNNR